MFSYTVLLMGRKSILLSWEGDQKKSSKRSLCLFEFYYGESIHSFFFYKNLFYKNVETEIYQNFKNMLRTYPRLRERNRLSIRSMLKRNTLLNINNVVSYCMILTRYRTSQLRFYLLVVIQHY